MRRISKKERDLLGGLMRRLGSAGGRASAKVLTPAQRTARARKAGKARQAKARREKGGRR